MSYHSDNFLQQLLIQATSFPGISVQPIKLIEFISICTFDQTKDAQIIT